MTKLTVHKGSITEINSEAIVNTTNNELKAGSGVDAAIHKAAGPLLQIECSKIGKCETGDAKITPGFKLKSKYVIHTAGPCYEETAAALLLESCYMHSLLLAKKYNIKTIAFPAISTGIQGYPVTEAAEIAVKAVRLFLNKFPDALKEITFTAFNEETYEAYKTLMS